MSESPNRRPRNGRCQFMQWAMVVAGVLLSARVVDIQVVRHAAYAARAQDQWTDDMTINAERGNLYDRRGRPMALSVTTSEVCIIPSRVKHMPKLCADLARILDLSATDIMARVERPHGRYATLGKDFVLSIAQKSELVRADQNAVRVYPRYERVYPTDGVGASLIGFYLPHLKKKYRAVCLELSLNDYLEGVPGRARELRTGSPTEKLGQVVLEKAVAGKDLKLTIDLDLQAICENQLAEAVLLSKAKGGSVLVMDPANGDILAAASCPLIASRDTVHNSGEIWRNSNFTQAFEPGSVAKIFTMASLMTHARYDTATVLNCDSSDDRDVYVDNDKGHNYGDLSLMQAFSRSSNIYFAKASANLEPSELHDDLLKFGFGRPPNVLFPWASAGLLRPTSYWSRRSLQTIAIGQEVAVSPVQLGAALCSVANGGILYRPRLVREIRSDNGELVEKVEPEACGRVMSTQVAALLREALARVVREGTGRAAQLDWIELGGKTGTSQKHVDGAPSGYTDEAYVVSFAGIVPVQKPRLVILTVLDRPAAGYRYAAQSAAPLFRDIVCDIRRATAWLTDVPGSRVQTLSPRVAAKEVTVPDVMYLSVRNALARLGERGLLIAGAEREGQIVEQVPAAGTRCAEGTVVSLTVAEAVTAAAPAAVPALCPDFKGLSNREVRSLAARLRVPVKVHGVGYVQSQTVAPGRSWRDGPVEVVMRERRP